ncbi:MAG: tachylectin-related carbohydrate-binding protein [Gammaproteobacteria bacterium]
MKSHSVVSCVAGVLAGAMLMFAGVTQAADSPEGPTRSTSQPLVLGTLVSPEDQEQSGLVTVSRPGGTCSGSLLRNNWVITAAHCIDTRDPATPGQFITAPENSITLTANWKKGAQVRQSMRIISFRPMDVAIVRVADVFYGREGGYNRDVYRGALVSVNVAAYGRGITQFAQGVGASAMPSSGDGLYRTANFSTNSETGKGGDHLVWFPTPTGSTIAGGDSGGPSFVNTVAGDLLFGVHARSNSPCLVGQSCPQSDQWTWAAATTQFADAPIAPLWDEINRYLGAFVAPAGFIGTFSQSPPNYQPMWIYGIRANGELLWYRKDGSAAAWQGPKKVGTGWGGFKDVIPAGGNTLYGLTNDGKLVWYRHDGFNDGSFAWSPPVEVGSGWTFARIFSGGQGIVYAIANDGTLVWYKNNGPDHGVRSWQPARVIGNGWGSFRNVFSTGQGAIYAVRNDGSLLLYRHDGYATGEPRWQEPRFVGSGWNSFTKIVPSSDGVILGILPNGKLLWFKDGRPAGNAIGRVVLTGPQPPPSPAQAMQSICDAALNARARNSPATPSLENQCRAFQASFVPVDAQTLATLAAKGPAIANADPLFTELRNRQPGPARDGFDIGMAAAEGQTAPGPGKQRIHDSLAPNQRPGFEFAVALAMERNRNADLAARGSAIARADRMVAETRTSDPDVFYWLGFDIATGLYGPANLGALGYTATGPGAYKIRDSLSAPGQRGFNAAVYFHLGVTSNPLLTTGQGPVEIGSGWQDFGKVTALLAEAPQVVR